MTENGDSAGGLEGGRSVASATSNAAAWVLLAAFVSLVLSVAVPAIADAASRDVAAALLFMLGMAASLLGSVLAFASSAARGRTVLGVLLVLVGLVLLYGLVPSIAALGVVLLGVAVQIGSLPDD
jgi:hypothetical protein